MAGYAKSVIFPASSTLPELAVAAFGGSRPELAYKVYVLLSAAAYPWLIALACGVFGLRGWGAAWAVGLSLVYIWTDWPLNYADFGMLPYFLGIPLALVATGYLSRFLERRNFAGWMMAAILLSLAVLVHLTTAMVAAPAALHRLCRGGTGTGRIVDLVGAGACGGLADRGRRAGPECVLVAAGSVPGVDEGRQLVRVRSLGREFAGEAGADRLGRGADRALAAGRGAAGTDLAGSPRDGPRRWRWPVSAGWVWPGATWLAPWRGWISSSRDAIRSRSIRGWRSRRALPSARRRVGCGPGRRGSTAWIAGSSWGPCSSACGSSGRRWRNRSGFGWLGGRAVPVEPAVAPAGACGRVGWPARRAGPAAAV